MMGMHTYHNDLEGFHDDQVLHDGCEECERRGKNPRKAVAAMDKPTFAKACKRAHDYVAGDNTDEEMHIALCEVKVLATIGTIADRVAELIFDSIDSVGVIVVEL